MYRADVYFLCKQLAEVPIFVFLPVAFLSIFYWMVGLNLSFIRFIFCLVIVELQVQVVIGFSYMISCFASSVDFALAIGPPLIVPMMLFGGFFLNIA